MKLILILISLNIIKNENECCFESKYAFKNSQRITLSNFDNFSQLKFNCSQPAILSVLQFQPNKPIVLDNSLKPKDSSIRLAKQNLLVVYTRLKGFDQTHLKILPILTHALHRYE